MSQISPVITSAGLGSIWNATQDGFEAKITHVGVGLSGYTPSHEQESLQQEVGRFPVIDGGKVNDNQLYIYSQIDNEGLDASLLDENGGFWIKEIGFYLEDGTLFAVHSVGESGVPEAYKSQSTALDINYQLALDAIPSGSVTVVNTGVRFDPSMRKSMAELLSRFDKYPSLTPEDAGKVLVADADGKYSLKRISLNIENDFLQLKLGTDIVSSQSLKKYDEINGSGEYTYS